MRILDLMTRRGHRGDHDSPATYLNLMDQYRPCYRAADYPLLDRQLTAAEHRTAGLAARRVGLLRLDSG